MTRPAPQVARLGGIDLSYTDAGSGPAVVMVMGTGSPGRVWQAHQQPALLAAGYRVITFDNRGIAPSSECADGFSLADMVNDTAALIEHLSLAPAFVVGTSLGARITQELTLARPELVKAAVLLATYGRSTPMLAAFSAGERALYDNGIKLPPDYEAAVTAHLNLSPHTLADDRKARDWLDIIGFSASGLSPGVRAQLELHEREENRLAAYRAISRPVSVVAFADDRTLPAHLATEVAEAIPGAEYTEIERAGHFGYLEQPEETNRVILDFLGRHRGAN